MEPAIALPTLDLHDTLHRFAVDEHTVDPQLGPDHPIAQIRLIVDEMLDPLRQDFIHNDLPCTRPIIRAAPRNAQESTDSLTRSFALGDHTLDV